MQSSLVVLAVTECGSKTGRCVLFVAFSFTTWLEKWASLPEQLLLEDTKNANYSTLYCEGCVKHTKSLYPYLLYTKWYAKAEAS